VLLSPPATAFVCTGYYTVDGPTAATAPLTHYPSTSTPALISPMGRKKELGKYAQT